MTASEIIKSEMVKTGITLSELAEYADLGTKQNVRQILERKDLKVGTFVKMLETLGFQLVVQSVENDDEYVLDYEEV